jgi:hypothetical protein
MSMNTPKHDHEITLQGPGVAQPGKLADALICAKNGDHTTLVNVGHDDQVYVVPAGRYRKLCELEVREAQLDDLMEQIRSDVRDG